MFTEYSNSLSHFLKCKFLIYRLPLWHNYDKIEVENNCLEALTLKNIFKKYSFGMVKLFVTQCVIGLFGNILALFSASVKSTPVTVAISIFSMLFYFFLVYITVWEFGSKDIPAIEAGRTKRSDLTGLWIGLGANLPNIALATLHAICLPFANSSKLLSGVCGISRIATLFVHGMYTSIMSVIKIGDSALNTQWWAYFVICIPAIAVATVAYSLGSRDIHFTKLLLPMTPEELEIKREKKAKRK